GDRRLPRHLRAEDRPAEAEAVRGLDVRLVARPQSARAPGLRHLAQGLPVSDAALWQLPASALRPRIARREISPVELTRAVLERAEQLQPVLNCFITLCRDAALREAAAAERALADGTACGLLHGIP